VTRGRGEAAALLSLLSNLLGRNKTLPDVQGLDLPYVSCAAGQARPDGELKRKYRASCNSLGRNKTLPDVQGLDLPYVSRAAGQARPDGELKRNW
jgi:hypothetical protein